MNSGSYVKPGHGKNSHQIVAPDFSHLTVCDDHRHRASTRIQLRIEGTASDLLLQAVAAHQARP